MWFFKFGDYRTLVFEVKDLSFWLRRKSDYRSVFELENLDCRKSEFKLLEFSEIYKFSTFTKHSINILPKSKYWFSSQKISFFKNQTRFKSEKIAFKNVHKRLARTQNRKWLSPNQEWGKAKWEQRQINATSTNSLGLQFKGPKLVLITRGGKSSLRELFAPNLKVLKLVFEICSDKELVDFNWVLVLYKLEVVFYSYRRRILLFLEFFVDFLWSWHDFNPSCVWQGRLGNSFFLD